MCKKAETTSPNDIKPAVTIRLTCGDHIQYNVCGITLDANRHGIGFLGALTVNPHNVKVWQPVGIGDQHVAVCASPPYWVLELHIYAFIDAQLELVRKASQEGELAAVHRVEFQDNNEFLKIDWSSWWCRRWWEW